MTFVMRQFDNTQTLGEKLKAVRREANFTLSEMEKKTKIRRQFLQAIETGEYDKLPAPIYARNYLKVYVRALGADETYFLNQFEIECGTCDFIKNARLPLRRTRALQFLVASRLIKIGMFSLLALAVMIYIGTQLRSITAPPDLLVYEPNDGFSTSEAIIKVTGHAEDDTQVQVNGVNALLSQTGFFEMNIALERGLNVIEIKSTKRYSKPAIEYRRVVLNQDRSMSFLE